MSAQFDIIVRNALIFDGTGSTPVKGDIGVKDGIITALAADLTKAQAAKDINAKGKYLTPGLLDIHTHYDLEVELAPGLPESIRHGTTTVVMANCSLGLAFGAQRRDGADPIVDCFARVENVPKSVLKLVADKVHWNTSSDYLDHLETLNLGPNVATMIPHSMLRIEVMGLSDSINRDPTEEELQKMEALLETGLSQGYAGFSTDALPFHYLANQPNVKSRIPGQYGTYKEIKRLTDIVRRHDKVWQATPPKDSPLNVIRMFALTSGRFFGKPLKITAVAALDVVSNTGIVKLGRRLSKVMNSKLLGGHFRLQALAAPFKVWAEGPITPLFEEIPELRVLNECDVDDREARQRIYNDPEWQKAFLAMWREGKRGFGPARLKRLMKREDFAIDRDPQFMMVDDAPVKSWVGESFADIFARLTRFQNSDHAAAKNEEERDAFNAFPPISDEAEFFMHMLRLYDTDLIWTEVTANRDDQLTKELLFDPRLLPGFNDSGAHLVNMAFYDCNLRGLKLAATDGINAFSHMVHRLTQEPAEFFNLNTGVLKEGAQADFILINPEELQAYDGEAQIRRMYREEFAHHQLVNRSDGVVDLVVVGGKTAWEGTAFSSDFGQVKMGRLLRGHEDRVEEMAISAE